MTIADDWDVKNQTNQNYVDTLFSESQALTAQRSTSQRSLNSNPPPEIPPRPSGASPRTLPGGQMPDFSLGYEGDT